MVDQAWPLVAALMQRLLERVEDEVGPHRVRDLPANKAPREDVDHECGIDKPVGGGDVSEIGDPELVRSARRKLAVDQIGHNHRVVGARRSGGLKK